MIFMLGLICANINNFYLQYVSDLQFPLISLSGLGRTPQISLYTKVTPCSATKEQLFHQQELISPCRTRILEVPMVNKDEAWVKQDAESTGNLARRMKKREGKNNESKIKH